MRIQICAGTRTYYPRDTLWARPSLKIRPAAKQFPFRLRIPQSDSAGFITLKDTRNGFGTLPLTPSSSCLEK